MDTTRPPRDADSLFSIRIEGLTNNVQKEDLMKAFEKYGKIGDIYIPRNAREGGNRGFGFVRFFNQDDASEALKENGTLIDNETIKVNLAEARPPRRERRSSSRSYGRGRRSSSRSRSYGRRRHHSRSRSHRRHSRSRSYDRSHHSSSKRGRSSRHSPSRSSSPAPKRDRSISRSRSDSGKRSSSKD